MAGKENSSFEYIDSRADLTVQIDSKSTIPSLNVVLMGKGPFANDALKGLLDAGHNVVSVFGPATLDGKDPDAVRKTADDNKIANHKFSSLKEYKTVENLQSLKPDLIIGANLTAFIEDHIANIATLGMFGFHPSSLPEFRGSSAIPWQIIDGKDEIGMTCYVIGRDEQLELTANQPERKLPKGSRVNDTKDISDKGPILAQTVVKLSEGERTSSTAYSKKISKLGVAFVVDTTNRLAVAFGEGKIVRGQKQIKGEGSYQPPLLKEHVRINWSNGATEIDALIRGSQFNPGAWTQYKDAKKNITLYEPIVYEGPTITGGKIENITNEEVRISALGGGILGIKSMRSGEMITAAQEVKGTAMNAAEFVRKNKLRKGSRFT